MAILSKPFQNNWNLKHWSFVNLQTVGVFFSNITEFLQKINNWCVFALFLFGVLTTCGQIFSKWRSFVDSYWRNEQVDLPSVIWTTVENTTSIVFSHWTESIAMFKHIPLYASIKYFLVYAFKTCPDKVFFVVALWEILTACLLNRIISADF